jgi:hypothetical protein
MNKTRVLPYDISLDRFHGDSNVESFMLIRLHALYLYTYTNSKEPEEFPYPHRAIYKEEILAH